MPEVIVALYLAGESCNTCNNNNNDLYCPYEDHRGSHPKPDVHGVKICHKHSNAWKYKDEDSTQYDSKWAPSASTIQSRTPARTISSRKIIILNLFLGWLGVHRFYVGKTGWGILYAISLGFIFIGVAVDMMLIARGKFDDSVEEASTEEKKFCWIIAVLILIIIIALHMVESL